MVILGLKGHSFTLSVNWLILNLSNEATLNSAAGPTWIKTGDSSYSGDTGDDNGVDPTTITNNGRIETRQSSNFGYGYPINNLGTIGDIVNSGDIFSNSRAAIYNWSPGTISKIENTATGDIYAKREFAIGNSNTIGTITNAGMIRAGKGQTIKNSGSGDTITLIENTTSSATIKGEDDTIKNPFE